MTVEMMGAALMDSFWWITAVAVLVGALLRLSPGLSPAARYLLVLVALLAAPLLLLAALQPATTPRVVRFAGAGWARPLGMVWMAGVALLSLRVLGGWVYLRLLIRNATASAWPAMEELRHRMQIRRAVDLRITSRVDSPFTAGWRRPVIVLPIAVLSGLPADQLEAILLHELAHIRRLDYIAEWLLQALETAFFYHPAVWWMAAAARAERERSCDDMAIAAGAGRVAFARALVRMEEMRVPAPALGWADGGLQTRVARILGVRQRTALWPVLLLAGLGVIGQVPTAWQRWVEQDVVYIIQPEEKRAYLDLRTDEERTEFIRQFWERRDPTPGTPRNEAKEEHYRRIAAANTRYTIPNSPGWRSDRGAMYIRFGPPDEIESHPARGGAPATEKWLYRAIPGVGANVILEFFDPNNDGAFRMTKDPNARP